MSRGAKLSIMGLYRWDETIFNNMAFPEDFSNEQKAIVTDNILLECANLEVIYPDPAIMKTAIGSWSKMELPYWDRAYKASLLEYDPLENYHRYETESGAQLRDIQHSGTDTSSASGNSTDTNSGTDTSNGYIAAYDSPAATLVNNEKGEMIHGHVVTSYDSSSSSMIHGEKVDDDEQHSRNLEAYGNIGTMTSQQMLTAEQEVAKLVNILPVIVNSFKERFCIQVY